MPNHTRRFAAIAVCGSMLVTTAFGSVTPIGEFVGDAFENFEAIGPPAPWPGAMPILGGAATFNDQFTDPWIATSLSSGDTVVFPYDGNFMGLTPTGWTRFTFAAPIVQFGGFIATASQGTGGRARFYDVEGGLIDSLLFETPVGEWTWHGWQSTIPIASIEIDTALNPGTTTVYDNLQMTALPSPSALALLLMGAGVSRRRRS